MPGHGLAGQDTTEAMPEALKMASIKMENKDFLIDESSRKIAMGELVAACIKNCIIDAENVKQVEFDGKVCIIYDKDWKRLVDINLKDDDAKFIYDYNNAVRLIISRTEKEEDWPALITMDAILIVPGVDGTITRHQITDTKNCVII